VQAAKLTTIKAVSPYLIAGWISEGLWQISFNVNKPASLLICAFLLIAGATFFICDRMECSSLPADVSASRLLLIGSTSINAAWMTVASAVGTLVAISVYSDVELKFIAVAFAAVVAAIGVVMVWREQSIAYALTIVWAFSGVYAGQKSMRLIQILALFVIVAFGSLAGIVAVQMWRTRKHSNTAVPAATPRTPEQGFLRQ
jgi:uncharacterized membrane protein YfcA